MKNTLEKYIPHFATMRDILRAEILNIFKQLYYNIVK